MILRDARRRDEAALVDFDLGQQHTVWLDEVSEIVSGLIAWRDDNERADLDRRVIVADINGELVAVAAHERSEDQQRGPLAEVRYLMVVAVRDDRLLEPAMSFGDVGSDSGRGTSRFSIERGR